MEHGYRDENEQMEPICNSVNKIKERLEKMGHKFSVEKPIETEEERRERILKRERLNCQTFNEGKKALNKSDDYNCDICHNKGGYMAVVDNGRLNIYSEFRNCKCTKIREMLSKLKKSGLSKSIKEYSFEKFEDTEDWQKKMKEIAMRFTKDDENTWFFIGGQSGAGKSHLCTAITAHYLRQNKAARYMLWRDDITRLKSIITDYESYGKEIEELKKVEVLYIDDIFKVGKDLNGNVQRPTPADINIAFEILNNRYNNRDLITIISSERRINEIFDIDEAVGGRIYELCNKGGYLINLSQDSNKNYRRKGIIEL